VTYRNLSFQLVHCTNDGNAAFLIRFLFRRADAVAFRTADRSALSTWFFSGVLIGFRVKVFSKRCSTFSG
jgi:hypothetical protein